MIPCARRIAEFLSLHTQGALETCKCLAPTELCLSGKTSRAQTKSNALEKSTVTLGWNQTTETHAGAVFRYSIRQSKFDVSQSPTIVSCLLFSKLFSLSLYDFLFSCLRIAPKLSLKGTKVSQCFQRFKVLKAQHSLFALKGGSFVTLWHKETLETSRLLAGILLFALLMERLSEWGPASPIVKLYHT